MELSISSVLTMIKHAQLLLMLEPRISELSRCGKMWNGEVLPPTYVLSEVLWNIWIMRNELVQNGKVLSPTYACVI